MLVKIKTMKKNDLVAFIEKHWNVPDYEVAQACDIMNRSRCPLSMVGNSVYSTLQELVSDFLLDNELTDDWFEEVYNGDYEELFWDLKFLDE